MSPLTGRVHRTGINPLGQVLLGMAALGLAACSAVPQDYAASQPRFDMRTFFNGPLEAWGMFQDRSGKVVQRFHVVMTGRWQGDAGTLEEHFRYADGTTSQRTWTFHRVDDHHITGRAGDVIGEASGEAYGFALHWNYVLALPVGDSVYNVRMDDWMYLVDEQTLLNRTQMTKFGFRVGEVTLVIRRVAPSDASTASGRTQ